MWVQVELALHAVSFSARITTPRPDLSRSRDKTPCGNCYFRVAPAARNYRLEATSPALPPVTRDLTPSSSDPDLATAGNTLFWPSDRRHCPMNTYSSGHIVVAGFQLRAACSLRPCAAPARVRAVAIRGLRGVIRRGHALHDRTAALNHRVTKFHLCVLQILNFFCFFYI
jgi:hypothetical protein